MDPGLATYLVRLHDRDAILNGPSVGALTETAVVGEWIKNFRQRGVEPQIYYWRGSADLEVDIIIEHNQRIYAVEVKSTATPRPAHAESIQKWLRKIHHGAVGVVACRVDDPVTLAPGIRAVPWHLAWC